MRRKLLVVTVEAGQTDRVIAAARQAGASGATLIHQARGEGAAGLSGSTVTRTDQGIDSDGGPS